MLLPMIAKIVMGECESCTFVEKLYVAAVVKNRLNSEQAFNKLPVDFYGYYRDINLDSRLTKSQYLLSILASVIVIFYNPNENIYFFSRNKPECRYYKLKGFKHFFY